MDEQISEHLSGHYSDDFEESVGLSPPKQASTKKFDSKQISGFPQNNKKIGNNDNFQLQDEVKEEKQSNRISLFNSGINDPKNQIRGTFRTSFKEPSIDPLPIPTKDRFRDIFDEPIKEPLIEMNKDSTIHSNRDPFKDFSRDSFKDPNKDQFKNDNFKEPNSFKEPRIDPFKESHKDLFKDFSRDSFKETNHDRFKETSQSSFKEINKDNIFKEEPNSFKEENPFKREPTQESNPFKKESKESNPFKKEPILESNPFKKEINDSNSFKTVPNQESIPFKKEPFQGFNPSQEPNPFKKEHNPFKKEPLNPDKELQSSKPNLNFFNKDSKKGFSQASLIPETQSNTLEILHKESITQPSIPLINSRLKDSEKQSAYETLFMKFKELIRINRETFAETCNKKEEKLFSYDDGTSPPSKLGPSTISIKSKSKYNLKRKIFKGFMTWDAFIKLLKYYEFSNNSTLEEIKSFLIAIKAIYNDKVFYAKLLREMYRKKPLYNLTTKAFQSQQTKEIDFIQDPTKAINLLKRQFAIYKEAKLKRISKEYQIKSDNNILQSEISYEDLLKNPEKTLSFIREKILASKIPLDRIFQSFDRNNDQKMSFLEFKAAMESTHIDFREELLLQVFNKFDLQGKGLVSYMDFLAVIYQSKNRGSFFDYLSEAEGILEDLRIKVRERFPEKEGFIRIARHLFGDKAGILIEDFLRFINGFTDRYSRIQVMKLFEYLDKTARKSLIMEEFYEVFEHQVQKLPISMNESPLIVKEEFKEFEMPKNQEINDWEDYKKDKGIWDQKQEDKPRFVGLKEQEIREKISILTGGAKKESVQTKNSLEKREKMIEMEMFLQELSEKTKELLKLQGKNLRDLFNMFSQEFFGYANLSEFQKLLNFIWKEEKGGIKTAKDIFGIYANKITKRIAFTMFLHLVNLGQKINPLYLKFKFRFGNSLESIKNQLMEEFQKLDAQKGSGLLEITYFEKILKTNDISLSYKDRKYLTDEGFLLVKSPSETFLNYRRLLPTIFPQVDQLTQEFMQKAIKTICRIRLYIKKKKALQLKEIPMKESNLSYKRKTPFVAFKEPERMEKLIKHKDISDLKQLGSLMKGNASEIFDMEVGKPETLQNKSLKGRKPSKMDNSLKKSTLKSQMQDLLPIPPKKEDPIQRETRQKISNYLKTLIEECITSAFLAGESLLLTKEIQHKYEKRPVLKDIFLSLKDQEIEILDILPRSLQVSTGLSRVLFLSKDGLLQQLDVSNGSRLNNLNLGNQIPLKSSKILDSAFDSAENRLYCLTDKWVLEVWDLYQEKTVPISRVRILPYKGNFPELMERAYGTRTYAGDFPQLLTLAANRPKQLLINCSAINNSIIFFDPVSLSISNQVFLNLRDYRLTRNLAKNINKITLKLQDFQKSGIGFESLFKIPKDNTIVPSVSFEAFRGFFKKQFPEVQDPKDIEEIIGFINQKDDNLISKDEFLFLFDLPKILNLNKPQNSLHEKDFLAKNEGNPLKKLDITEKAVKILKKMSDFFKKAQLSPYDAFRIFDSNNSGFISIQEFYKIVDQISGFSATEEEKEELVLLFDKDNNGTIEYNEFLAIYTQILPNNPISNNINSLNQRNSLLGLFEKCFEAGVDIEREFLNRDPLYEGTLDYTEFKNLLKWLPLGLLEGEITGILNEEVTFCENARVNYLVYLQNPLFRQLKLRFLLKKSLINQAEFDKLMKELSSEENLYENSQKIIIESLLYLESFDLILYTTSCPISSIIYISTSAKTYLQQANKTPIKVKPSSFNERLFENKLLARLIGHKSSYPPSIFYCEQSGCLVSGEKLEKTRLPTEKNGIYTNIEVSKDLCSDILIWNLQGNLFENYHMNPPWTITPCYIIAQAHYDSILDFSYLPIGQILCSCSLDQTIKFWDPVSRPFPLNNVQKEGYIRIKPGVYRNPKGETTKSNKAFRELHDKRIYTGDRVCYKLAAFCQKVPLHGLNSKGIEGYLTKTEEDPTKRFSFFESLFTLELSKPQMIGNCYKRPGILRGFFIERFQGEVEARFHDEILPEKDINELELLFVERKRSLKAQYQRAMPLTLESVKSRLVLQRDLLRKLASLLKRISLLKFQKGALEKEKEVLREIYDGFGNLPMRTKYARKEGFEIAEIFFYLKKFHALHPFSLTKEQFEKQVMGLNDKKKPFLADLNPSVKRTGLSERLSKLVLEGPSEAIEELFNLDITKEMIQKALEKVQITYNMEEFMGFWDEIDPYRMGSIPGEVLKVFFSDQLLEKGLKNHSKPQEIVVKLLKSMKKQQKILLMFFLSEEDYLQDGYLVFQGFYNALNKAGVSVDIKDAKILFESFSERFSTNDHEKVLNIAFFSKKFFSTADHFYLQQVYRALGKLKASLLAKGFPLDYFFRDFSKGFSELKIEDTAIKPLLTKEELSERIKNTKIITETGVNTLVDFLSMGVNGHNAVSVEVFLHYIRKTQTKQVFSSLDDYKALSREAVYIVSKEKEIKELYKGEKLGLSVGEIRYLLMKYDVPNEIIDEILMRFLENTSENTIETFFMHLKTLAEHFTDQQKPHSPYKSVENPYNNTKEIIFEKSINTNLTGKSIEKSSIPFTFGDILKESSPNKSNRGIIGIIRSYQHTEALVNFIRTKAGNSIKELLAFCEKFDEKHEGTINFSAFLNIIKVLIENLPEKLLYNYSQEYKQYNPENPLFDYKSFYNQYLKALDPLTQENNLENPSLIDSKIDLNQLYQGIQKVLQNSNVNLNYAIKFFDQEQSQCISFEDFKQMLSMLKIELSPLELKTLAQDLKKPSMNNEKQKKIKQEPYKEAISLFYIDSERFLKNLRVCNKGISTYFNEEDWVVCKGFVSLRLVEVAYKNSEFLRFLLEQKKNKKTPIEEAFLITAKDFFAGMSELKADFSLKDAENLTKYAILGSKPNKKEVLLLETLPEEDLVHIDYFFLSLPIIYTQLKASDKDKIPDILLEKAQLLTEEAKFLLAKISGSLKDRDVSIWDALLTSGVQLDEKGRLPLLEFKALLRSLDLQLTLKEKLLLFSSFSTTPGSPIDMGEFLKRVESKAGLSESAIRALMEKLAVNLFYNDMSLQKAFDIFDLNKNGSISRSEFTFGMGQLDLGLSLFEISQVLGLMDVNHDGVIEKEEFLGFFKGTFQRLGIDPVKDFSLGLLAKIKNLFSVKGCDLLQCFLELDTEKTGYVDISGLKIALTNFGLSHIKPYEITTLIRLYYEYEEKASIEKNLEKPYKKAKNNRLSSPEKSHLNQKTKEKRSSIKKKSFYSTGHFLEKLDYRLFTKRLLEITDKNSKTELELTNELFRKVYRLFSLKNISLFEAFVYFDINSSYTLSKLELKLGFNSLDLHLTDFDFLLIWNGFQKTQGFQLRFPEFQQRFVQAGAVTLIKFDDQTDLLIKRFVRIVQKFGNYEEAFRKFDKNLSGQVSLTEFKDTLKRCFLGFTPQEAELVFRNLSHPIIPASSMKKDSESTEPANFFGYRQFSKILSQHSRKSLEIASLAKLWSFSTDKAINWKSLFLKHSQGGLSEAKTKNPNELLLQEVKRLLKGLKAGLSNEEIDSIVNACRNDPISSSEFESLLSTAQKAFDISSREASSLISDFFARFRGIIEAERLQLERLFFDFDEKQQGFLDLAGFNQLALFLRLPANKHQIKLCFNVVDTQKKGFITLGNLKGFLEETIALSQVSKPLKVLKEEEKDFELIRVLEKIKATSLNPISMSFKKLDLQGREPLNEKTLGKLLLETGVVLPAPEIGLLLNRLKKDFPEKKLAMQDFLEFSLRKGLENSQNDTESPGSLYIPAQVVLGLEKLLKIARRLEIPLVSVYKHFKKPQKASLSKKDLLKGLQAMDMGLLKEDLLLIYQYIDEKGYGEVSDELFLERIELVSTIKQLTSTGSNKEEIEENLVASSRNFASKQQAILTLQRVAQSLESKGFNRKQIKGLFDRNNNGLLSREEFLEGLKSLELPLALDKCRILVEFLDKKDNGVINLEDFLQTLYESHPDKALSGNYKDLRVREVLLKLANKVKVRSISFLSQMVHYERLVRPSESFLGLSRLKIGIQEVDFFLVLREFGLKVTEEEKLMLKDFFQLRINPEYIDLEEVYSVFEALFQEISPGKELMEQIPEKGKEELEAQVYRNIASFLRENNMSLLAAFQCIDQDRSGLISHEEFRRFIRSIETCRNLSEKDLLLLVSTLANPKPGFLSYADFRNKFLWAYSETNETTPENPFKDPPIMTYKLQDMRLSDKRVILKVLYTLMGLNNVEKAWVALDISKRGVITPLDLTEAIKALGLYLNKGELGLLFNFIDRDQDGVISFMEFLDFYNINQNVSVGAGVQEVRKVGLHELEFEIFEHICRILNQKEISLFTLFQESDPENKGFLTVQQFITLLSKTGVRISSDSFSELIRILDFKHPDRLTYQDIESKLAFYGLKVQTPSTFDSFEFKDSLLMRFITKASTGEFLKILQGFDNDFDGFLTTQQFFLAIRSFKPLDEIKDFELQRLSHIFKPRNYRVSSSEIELARVKKVLDDNISIKNDKKAFINDSLLTFEAFGYVLNQYDGFNRLFKLITELKGKIALLKTFPFSQNLRGLKLIGNKGISFIIAQIQFEESLENSLKFTLNLIKAQISLYINNESAVRLLNPLKGALETLETIDKQQLQHYMNEISNIRLKLSHESSSFSLDNDSLTHITPFLRKYNGFSFEKSRKIEAFVYGKEILTVICADGLKYEEHLFNELRLQAFINNENIQNSSFLNILIGIYEKKLGLEPSDRELFVLQETFNDQDYVSLESIILQTGGLIRIPFLTKTGAVGLILKLWAGEILRILAKLQDLGHILPFLSPKMFFLPKEKGGGIRLSGLKGLCQINEQGTIFHMPDLGLYIPGNLDKEACLAPEILKKSPLENTHYIESWGFGCLLYQLVFGTPPKGFFERDKGELKSGEPSSYAYYEVFSEKGIEEILKFDYHELGMGKEGFLACAIEKKDFSGLFEGIFERKFDEGFAEIINLIGLCLQYDPIKRPSIKNMACMPLFQQDKYLETSAKEFARSLSFFKSPSQSLKTKVLDPLQHFYQKLLKGEKISNLTSTLLNIIEILCFAIFERGLHNKKLTDLKKNIISDIYKKEQGGAPFPWHEGDKKSSGEEIRSKLPNFGLVKFIFDYEILELLVFVVLRSFKNSSITNKQENTSKINKSFNNIKKKNKTKVKFDDNSLYEQEINVNKYEAIENSDYKGEKAILFACRDLFRLLFSELSSYDTAASPYVDKILNVFVKLFIGEEFTLISDQLSGLKPLFTKESVKNSKKHPNSFNTNKKKSDSNKTTLENSNMLKKPSFLSQKPTFEPSSLLFRSLIWNIDLLHIFGSLYKDTISESGIGKTHYPVLQDFLIFCDKQQKVQEFKPLEKIIGLNSHLSHLVPKGFDYYRDLYTNAENLKVLLEKDQKPSSLRIVVSYIKGVLESNNTDKIKALLDSKTPVFLINTLNNSDPHLRTSILEVFYLLSEAFNSEERAVRPELEEVNKTLGIITHIALNSEDRLDRERFVDCSNEYFLLNKRVIKDFLAQMAGIFASPAIISPLFSGLKSPNELQVNKILILRTFYNLMKAPENIIRNLTTCSLDVFPSVFKLLVSKPNINTAVLNKSTKKNGISGTLIAEVLRIVARVSKDSRPELLQVLEETPGIRALLREQGVEIPIRLSIMYLHSLCTRLKTGFEGQKQELLMEIKGSILKKNGSLSKECPRLNELKSNLSNCIEKFLSWLKFYYNRKESPLIEAWKLSTTFFSTFISIANEFFLYGNISPHIAELIIMVAEFPDKICKLEMDFVLFNGEFESHNLKYFKWMLEMIQKINHYHNQNWENELLNQSEAIDLEDMRLKDLIAHETLRKYAKNLLSPASQALNHVFLRLLVRNDLQVLNSLKHLRFAEFFLGLSKLQYSLLQSFMENKTEDIQVIEDYVEEANVRMKTFDLLIGSSHLELKKPFIETHFLQYLTGTLLLSSQGFDTQAFKSSNQFLAFREFLPLRNEGLTMLTSIVWHKKQNEQVYKELLVGISHNNLIQRVYDEVRKNKEGILSLAGLFFFSIMVNNGDEQIIYLMKQEGIFKFIAEVLERNHKIRGEFPDLQKFLKRNNY